MLQQKVYKVYQEIASLVVARQNCEKSNNSQWFEKKTERIEEIVKEFLPSGSGIDAGVSFDFDKSNDKKLVFNFSFHHMNDAGYYDGWTSHELIITPSFSGYDARITGPNKNDIKDYLHEIFNYALCTNIVFDAKTETYTKV